MSGLVPRASVMLHLVRTDRIYPPETVAVMAAAFLMLEAVNALYLESFKI